jgi:hypothetical protein
MGGGFGSFLNDSEQLTMTQKTTTQPNNPIRFDCHHSGELETYGFSSMDRLFEIGALSLTRKKPTKETGYCALYQTDLNGLKKALGMTEQARDSILDYVESLGAMLAYLDVAEVPGHHIQQLGWLLASLGKLANQLSFEAGEIQHHLETATKFYQGEAEEKRGADHAKP